MGILVVQLPNPIALADLAANMIGRSNARRGARRIFAVLQNRRLNQHLVYTIVDEVRQCHYVLLGTHSISVRRCLRRYFPSNPNYRMITHQYRFTLH